MVSNLSAQDLSQHQWKHRVLLVLSNDASSPLLKKQVAQFQQSSTGYQERKLIVYQILPHQYKLTFFPTEENQEWINSTLLFEKYGNEASFQVLLLGLDGGIKLRQNEVLTSPSLFAIIDAMPMRIGELRHKNK